MFTLKIQGKTHTVASLSEASAVYCAMRDASHLGSSKFPSVKVYDAKKQWVARISYNGRVWPPKEWDLEDVPLLESQA